ncbi:hypothetical protein ACVIJ6_000247 [Bradyrhizobium sp. USDA 4369]
MSKSEIIRRPRFGSVGVASDGPRSPKGTGEVVRGIDFRSKRRERIYDPDKIWSGEHTMQDFIEV